MNRAFKLCFENLTSKVKVSAKRFQYSTFEGSPHKPNYLEKRFLVWTGKFKTVEEVPSFVSQTTMERCRNRMRIRIANYMMVATALGCIAMVYVGKQNAKSGNTLTRINLNWHKDMDEMETKKVE